MANTTVRGAEAIHGQNPQVRLNGYVSEQLLILTQQYLVETVIRNRIYESPYWKEHCFALTGQRRASSRARLVSDAYLFSGVAHRQGHRAEVHRRCIWQPEANRIPLLATQATTDPTTKGDPLRISSGRRIQVRD